MRLPIASPQTPSHAAQQLARLSVSLRLRLLLVGLLAMLLCSVTLFWLSEQYQTSHYLLQQRTERTLNDIRTAQQAKDALVVLRRALALSITGVKDSDPIAALQKVIKTNLPRALASAATLEPIDPAVALRVRTAAETFSHTAMTSMAAFMAGDELGSRALFGTFAQVGAPADDALDTLMARQQNELRRVLSTAEPEQRKIHGLTRILHLLLLALATAAALMVLRALFRPVQRLCAALNIMAEGKALKAPPVSGNDEFGQLGTALHALSQLTAQLNDLAFRDPLTAVPNRTQFEHDLAAALSKPSPFAVVFVDIDHFRTLNDGYGHFFGDQVLKAVTARLQWLIHGNTRLYRYSGDLFAVVIESGDAFSGERFRSVIAAEAERLRSCMTELLTVEGRSLALCFSLGVALYPDDGVSTETLVSAVDAAMYQAKQMGRNVVQFARSDSALKARQRIELADELRLALKAGLLAPHFQPIVDLGSGQIVCAEALARWQHPTRGFVPPDEFIAIAEESGQLDLLTDQLLRSACATAVQWQPSEGRAVPRLAFNLSARQLRPGVVERISQVLADTGLPAEQLEIEITESAIIERPEVAERLLNELKSIGVSVALDDFGTGYSSLSYLLRFPIDKIKIDRSFVAHLNGQRQAGKIVAATISLATNLEIVLVAEGVENIGQMLTLYELGCRQQQGWLFSKALPAAEFNQWAKQAPLRLNAVVRAQAEAANEIQSAA